MDIAAFAFWLLFLGAAVFYTRRNRHPEVPPIAAYLIFVTVFTLAAFAHFAAVTALAAALGLSGGLGNPFVATVLMVAIFAPAFLLADWQLRQPPRRPPHQPAPR